MFWTSGIHPLWPIEWRFKNETIGIITESGRYDEVRMFDQWPCGWKSKHKIWAPFLFLYSSCVRSTQLGKLLKEIFRYLTECKYKTSIYFIHTHIYLMCVSMNTYIYTHVHTHTEVYISYVYSEGFCLKGFQSKSTM